MISLICSAVYFVRFIEVSILILLAAGDGNWRPKEKPQQGLGGFALGLPIFETKTHPVTIDIMIDGRIRFLMFQTKALSMRVIVRARSRHRSAQGWFADGSE
jgi:hypothetical protein